MINIKLDRITCLIELILSETVCKQRISIKLDIAQSAEAVKYTDCISAEV